MLGTFGIPAEPQVDSRALCWADARNAKGLCESGDVGRAWLVQAPAGIKGGWLRGQDGEGCCWVDGGHLVFLFCPLRAAAGTCRRSHSAEVTVPLGTFCWQGCLLTHLGTAASFHCSSLNALKVPAQYPKFVMEPESEPSKLSAAVVGRPRVASREQGARSTRRVPACTPPPTASPGLSPLLLTPSHSLVPKYPSQLPRGDVRSLLHLP